MPGGIVLNTMAFQGDSIFWVEVEKIVANPFQPRREFDEAKLKELAESIRMYGILQPLTVTRKEIQRDDGSFHSEYELIAGERRLRAARLAGLEQVPVIIRSGEDTEQEKLELAIIENLQREDLNAVDRALAFKQLAETFNLSHSQVAKKVGRSREYVSNTIRLLALPEYMLNSLKLGDISEGHARSLLMLKDRPEEQDVVYREILLKKISVREVERITRKIAADKVRKKKWTNTDPQLIALEKDITDTLGTRVQISKTDYGGKLTIDYFSDEDLQKILSLLKAEQDRKDAARAQEESESQTVIRDLSPEASVVATLAATTPLDVSESQDESMQETVTDTPIAPTEDRQGIPSAALERPVSHQVGNSQYVAKTYAEEQSSDPQEPVTNQQPVQELAPQTPDGEGQVPPADSTTAQQTEVTQEQGINSEVQPAVSLEDDDEFAFITKRTAGAEERDLVNPYVPPEVPDDIPVPDDEEIDLPEEKADDEDLYSIKNFSV